MELTPDLLLEAKFSSARRGYDMAEVDDFLERCAEGLDVLLARLKAEFERAERAEAVLAERSASPPADAVQAPRAEPVPETEPEPERPAPAPATQVDVDEPMRVLVMAERTAEATISEAKADAERIRNEAESVASRQRSEAERLLSTARADAEAEAKRAGDTTRREIQQEVDVLRRDRDGLSTDIRNLRRWLDEQRGRMRTTARELNRLIEDPTALREFPAPGLSEEAGASADSGGTDPSADADAPDDHHDDDALLGALSDLETDGEPTQAVPPVEFGSDDEPGGPASTDGEDGY